MKPENILDFLLQVDNLKDVLRVGWNLAGLTYHRGESVAEHSWGTMNVALFIGNYLKEENTDVEMFKVMVMAIIHDYAESLISDIPKPAMEIGGDELVYGKHKAEVSSIQMLLDTHQPLDLVMVFLGANDCKTRCWNESLWC